MLYRLLKQDKIKTGICRNIFFYNCERKICLTNANIIEEFIHVFFPQFMSCHNFDLISWCTMPMQLHSTGISF